ncbi:MAG: hypothetical protein ACOYOU_04220 [Kiritimatiellia bacterium]
MEVLLNNCYSKDVVDIVTSLIKGGNTVWKSRVYSPIQWAPISISDEQWKIWLHMLEEGQKFEIEKMLEHCGTNTNAIAKMREKLTSFYFSTNWMYNVPMQARRTKEYERQKQLLFLNVDTNRPMGWIKEATVHKDDAVDW